MVGGRVAIPGQIRRLSQCLDVRAPVARPETGHDPARELDPFSPRTRIFGTTAAKTAGQIECLRRDSNLRSRLGRATHPVARRVRKGPTGTYGFTLVPVETSCGVWFVHRPFHAGRDLDGAGPGVTRVGYHDAPGDDVCMMNHIDSI